MKKLVMAVLCMMMLCSCKTYYISVDSLRQQFSGIDSSKMKEVAVKGPVGETYRYQANPITNIMCVDKNQQPATLTNSPSIETRITHNGKRTIFYFDRLYVTDSTVTGVQSRFIGSIRKTIPLANITKIEVQDGKKKYRYE